MLKQLTKIMFIAILLASQAPSAHAGVDGRNFDVVPALVTFGVTAAAVGAVGTLALVKSYQWAKQKQSLPKRYIGRTVLGAASAGSILGIGYLMGYAKRTAR